MRGERGTVSKVRHSQESGVVCRAIMFSCYFSSGDALEFVDEYKTRVSCRSCNKGPWSH